jgi:CTD kinase subunit beta
MYEASAFDFRARYPHKMLVKLAKHYGINKDTVGSVAWDMLMDLYKTFAPLKQTSATMAISCIKLAILVEEEQQDVAIDPEYQYSKPDVLMETMHDLLDMYTHFQKSSIVGSRHPMEKFIQLRIKLNKEMEDASLSRYTCMLEPAKNGFKNNVKTPQTPITPASPADTRINGKDVASPATLSPRSSSSKRGVGARGQDGTIRFMQDAATAKDEKEVVAEYFKEEFEEYEVEVDEPIKQDQPHNNNNNSQFGGRHHHRNDRFHGHGNKRSRR